MISIDKYVKLIEKFKKPLFMTMNEKYFNLYFRENEKDFILEQKSSSDEKKHLTNSWEDISYVDKDGETYYSHKALNSNYPSAKYSFYSIFSTKNPELFDEAIFKFKSRYYEAPRSFLVEIEHGIKVDIKSYKCRDILFIKFKTNKPIHYDYLIGLTLRFRHALVFLGNDVESNEPVLLLNSEDSHWLLTVEAKVNSKSSYSIFGRPYNWNTGYPWGLDDNDLEVYPLLDSNFYNKVIEKTMCYEAMIFETLLILNNIDNVKDAYMMAVSLYIALEILVNNYTSTIAYSEGEKIIIANIIKDFTNILDGEYSSGDKGKEVVANISKKLNSFYSPTNADKARQIFNDYKISLSEKDEKNIILRNKYLHGGTSFKAGKELDSFYTSLRTYRLISTLIAKLCGYEGYLCKFDKTYIDKERKFKLNEIFVKI